MSTPIRVLLLALGVGLLFSELFYDLYRAASDGLQPNIANDALTHAWPFLSLARASIESGNLPLWNPYTSLGTPMLAEIGLGLFFPLAWIIFLLDVPVALLLIQFLTVALGMAGMFCYLRFLGLAPGARLLGVVLFAYAVFTESFYPTMGYSYLVLPVLLWLGHRVVQQPDLRNSVFMAIAIALCFLGGFPNYFVYTVILVGIYCACLVAMAFREIRPGGVALRAGMALLVMVLVLGLVAVQLLPALELSRVTARSLDSSAVYDASSVWEVFSLKLLLGNFIRTDLGYLFGNELIGIPSGYSYLGGLLLFIPFAFTVHRHRPVAVALAISLLLLSLFILSYSEPALALFQKLPFASAIRVNGRAAGYIQFVPIVLSCIGLSNLLQQSGRTLATRPGWLLFSAYAGWLGWVMWSVNDNAWFLVSYVACLLLVLLRCTRPANRLASFGAWLLLLVVIMDVSVHRDYRFLVPAFSPGDPTLVATAQELVRADDDHYRLVFKESEYLQLVMLANLGPKYGLPSIDAYMGLTLSRWENYVRYMLGPEEFDRLVAQSPVQRFYGYFSRNLLQAVLRQPEILELASLRYVISADGVEEMSSPVPRAYAVGHYVTTSSEHESLAMLKERKGRLRGSVVLENARPGFIPGEAGEASSKVQIVKHSPNEVVLLADVAQPSVVVLNDAYYPGWTASVDGTDTPVFRANSLFRAVEVPPGKHRVIFRYEPTSLYAGFWITLSSVMLLAIILGRRKLAGRTAA